MSSITQTLCSISTLFELQSPPAVQSRSTLELPGKMQGLPYQTLSKLDTSDLDTTATYFNEYTENRYKPLSSIFCQGLLCVNDRDSGSPELFIRATTMAMHVQLPSLHLDFYI